MSKRTTVTTDTTAQNTGTTTPNVPDWIQQPAQNIAGGINAMVGAGPAAMTPHTNALQEQSWDTAAGLKGATGADWTGADTALGNVGSVGDVSGESVLSGLDQYYNPFKNQITDPVLADYDFQAGQQRAAQAADAAKNVAFRGSRYGVQEGQTEGALARGRATTESGLLKDMYGQAASMSEADAARRQQANLANQTAQGTNVSNELEASRQAADLAGRKSAEGLALTADERATLAAQGLAGSDQYKVETGIQQYPMEYLKNMEGLLAGLDPALFTGQTMSGTSTTHGTEATKQKQGLIDWLGQMATAASAGAGSAAASGG